MSESDMIGMLLAQPWYALLEHAVAAVALLWAALYVIRTGPRKVLGNFLNATLNSVPGAKGAVESGIRKDVEKLIQEKFGPARATPESKTVPVLRELPAKAVKKSEILRRLKALDTLDLNVQKGRAFAYVYAFGQEHKANDADDSMTHHQLVAKAFEMYIEKNGLNMIAFPALRRLETETVSMVSNLLNGGPSARGTLTTGGTESILMAVKAYRERGRAVHGITQPNMVLCISAHVAFAKAAHYFGVEAIWVPMGSDYRVNLAEMKKRINSNTVLLVGSAPQYPHGVIDPIEEIAAIGRAKDIPVHVDACVGGLILPFLERLKHPRPLWDFRVAGVTSISADLHKYGYAAKGASCLVFRNDDYRQHQFFTFTQWPGGLFISPSALGTRGGGPIAAAWAAMLSMGEDGYLEKAKSILDTAKYIRQGLTTIPALRLMGQPDATIVSFEAAPSEKFSIFAVADVMEEKFGWTMEKQQNPNCIHMTLMPVHASVKEQLIKDLKASVEIARSDMSLSKKGSAATYGLVASIPSEEVVETYLNIVLQQMLAPIDS